jgi:hypothetical protein
MVRFLCPNSSCTVRGSTPAITKREQNVCRSECQVKSRTPALATAFSNQCRELARALRLPFRRRSARKMRLLISMRGNNALNAARAVLFNGICRVSPFFERTTVTISRSKLTLSQLSPYCSLRLSPVFKAIRNSCAWFGKSSWMTAHNLRSSVLCGFSQFSPVGTPAENLVTPSEKTARNEKFAAQSSPGYPFFGTSLGGGPVISEPVSKPGRSGFTGRVSTERI